jgi:hypothetical protein
VKRPCAYCGKECEEYQRNADGTYLHDACAYATATRIVKSEKESGESERTEGE